ncbi:MAG: GIY-YIG nuclease family protein [Bacteroidetes bacterium]|nr:GIY-YIG nuclease family protein [Bacteroidota bacterium]
MYAVIDVETTGLSPRTEKITEIAIYTHNGERIIEEFSTLINPEIKIPFQITRLTGINNQMVKDAPKFYEIAKKIIEITEGKILVGHNVSFDYNFIKSEFKSLGYDFNSKTLCTVKLARKLIPGKKSYGLGNLCKELNIQILDRHRASGDALAATKVLELLLSIDQAAADKSLKGFNSNLSKSIVQQLPEKAGVYYFYNTKQALIYVGKSKNIQSRVLSHLSNNLTRKAVEMKDAIADVDYKITGSELVALLLESHEIKAHKPLFNSAQRRTLYNYGLYKFKDDIGYIQLNILKLIDGTVPITSYTTMNEAKQHLYDLVEEYQLCQKLCGLYESDRACFHYQIHQCKGACVQEETPIDYNLRVNNAIKNYQFKNDSILIIDRGRNDEEKSVIKIEKGKYLGFGFFPVNGDKITAEELNNYIKKYNDNKDVQQIIKSYLRRNNVEAIINLDT